MSPSSPGCLIADCYRVVESRGVCKAHRGHSDALPDRRLAAGGRCVDPGCRRKAQSRGVCPSHREHALPSGRAGRVVSSAPLYCPAGHMIAADNVYRATKKGREYRRCVTCRRASANRSTRRTGRYKGAHEAARLRRCVNGCDRRPSSRGRCQPCVNRDRLADPAYRARANELARQRKARARRDSPAYRSLERAQSAAKSARRAAAAGAATAAQIAARWDYFGGLCWLCGAAATTVDHVKPLAKGGSNWPANLRPACGPCNSGKCARWPVDTSRIRH